MCAMTVLNTYNSMDNFSFLCRSDARPRLRVRVLAGAGAGFRRVGGFDGNPWIKVSGMNEKHVLDK
jgi:hypothetical protein